MEVEKLQREEMQQEITPEVHHWISPLFACVTKGVP